MITNITTSQALQTQHGAKTAGFGVLTIEKGLKGFEGFTESFAEESAILAKNRIKANIFHNNDSKCVQYVISKGEKIQTGLKTNNKTPEVFTRWVIDTAKGFIPNMK